MYELDKKQFKYTSSNSASVFFIERDTKAEEYGYLQFGDILKFHAIRDDSEEEYQVDVIEKNKYLL